MGSVASRGVSPAHCGVTFTAVGVSSRTLPPRRGAASSHRANVLIYIMEIIRSPW